jgi:2-iminobutanoate/2-iminopropanoate deaminase
VSKKVLTTPSAPAAMGPYSVAVEAGGFVFLSGQVALRPEGGRAEDDVKIQTRQVMENIGSILSDLDLDFQDVVKTTIFMDDMADYPVINEIYGEYFTNAPPARSAVQAAKLPGGFLVEVEMIVARPDATHAAAADSGVAIA